MHRPLASLSILIAVLTLAPGCAGPAARSSALSRSLTFHAPFDQSVDARLGQGDRQFQTGPQWGPPRETKPGLPPGGTVHLDPGAGRYGGALRFERKITEVVGFRVAGNLDYRTQDWSGTLSYWLRTSPDADLEPGYCDPLQITSKQWDDAAFFTEFTKDEVPREFRFGAYADRAVWNPHGVKWETMPMSEKPLAPVVRPPFDRGRWTHVVFTWEHFNTGRPEGVARLYLDGEPRGVIGARNQQFTWDPAQAVLMLGLAYTGWMDDLACFNRALTPAEVQALHRLPGGVSDLGR
jgi:hypothetical protein